MMSKRTVAAVCAITATAVMMCQAHTENPFKREYYAGAKRGWYSQYEASVKGETVRASERADNGATQDWPPKKWSEIPSDNFSNKDYSGIIVEHGTYLGRPLFWQAKWWTTSKDIPGQMPDSGSTSGWKLLNSSAAGVQNPNPVWEGADLTPGSSAQVKLPTWQDGAKGAYALISDDIGAFLDTDGYDQLVEIAEEVNSEERDFFGGYNAIRFGFGCQVDKSEDFEWEWMRNAVMKGHEILNHSYDHTSAASQWESYYPTDATGKMMEEIKSVIQKEGDTIPLSGTISGPDDPYVAHLPYVQDRVENGKTVKFPHIGKNLPKWCSGAIVLTPEGFDAQTGEEVSFGNFKIKNTANARYIRCNTKEYIEDTEPPIARVDCSVRMDDEQDPQDEYGKKYDGWEESEKALNVALAQDTINMEVYEKLNDVNHLKSPYWSENKRVDFYVYPYDAYDSTTHAYLEANDYVGARGGSKAVDCTPLDFFHPFRTDFDAHFGDKFGVKGDGQGKNPHQYLTLKAMLDTIVKQKGFHTRETHTVTDRTDIGWGPITEENFRIHLDDLMGRIKKGDITMYTPSDAVKYRITRDNMTIKVEEDGDKQWKITPTITLDEEYHEAYDDILITYAFTLPTNVTLADDEVILARYKNGEFPRRNPWLREGSNNWSVYADPYKGAIEVYVAKENTAVVSQKVQSAMKASFTGITDNSIMLNLPAGDYSARLYNVAGRVVASRNFNAQAGMVNSGLKTNALSNGLYFLSVEKDGVALLKGQKVYVK